MATERIGLVIYGIDDTNVRFDAVACARLRERLGLGEDVPVLLMVGCFVPKKRFSVGLNARADGVREAPRTIMLLVGGGLVVDEYRAIVFDGVNDYLHDPGDGRELARHTVELLRNPARRQDMGAVSLRLVRDLHLHHVTDNGEGRWRD